MRAGFAKLNWHDIYHSLLITIGTPMITFVLAFLVKLAGILSGGNFPTMADLPTVHQVLTVLAVAFGAGLTYLIKNFFSNTAGQFATKENELSTAVKVVQETAQIQQDVINSEQVVKQNEQIK